MTNSAPSADCSALFQIAPSLLNGEWKNDCCTAKDYVTCTDGRITELWLTNTNGTLLPTLNMQALSQLTELRTLELESSTMTGSLDGGLTSLSKLESLVLAGNSNLNAELPKDIKNMKRLRFLDLRKTSIHGAIPELPDSLSQCLLPPESQFTCHYNSKGFNNCVFRGSMGNKLAVCPGSVDDTPTSRVATDSTGSASSGGNSASNSWFTIPLILLAALGVGFGAFFLIRRRRVRYSSLGLPPGAQVPLQPMADGSAAAAAAARGHHGLKKAVKRFKLDLNLSGCLVYPLTLDAAETAHVVDQVAGGESELAATQTIVEEWRELFLGVHTFADRWLELHGPEVGQHVWDVVTAGRFSTSSSAMDGKLFTSSSLHTVAFTHLLAVAIVDFLDRFMSSELINALHLTPSVEMGGRLPPVFPELFAALMRMPLESTGESPFQRYLDAKVEGAQVAFRVRYPDLDADVRRHFRSAIETLIRIKMRKPQAALVLPQPGARFDHEIMSADWARHKHGVGSSQPLDDDELTLTDHAAVLNGKSPVGFCVFPGIIDHSTNSVLVRSHVWLRQS
ncbi:hypothetical protein GGF32_006638 [Allomyces javanicus]|nr:hypothetical protein GGF32_006638 [Allomyces javanicus]